MAAYLFDSSAVVKRYVRETGTVWVLSITAPTAGHFIYVAHITGAEVVSALVRQARHGALPPTAVTIGLAALCAWDACVTISYLCLVRMRRLRGLHGPHSDLCLGG